ncbi:MAG: GDSL family lipase [Lewinellaceae bacterium]|nr:GDSL family lipase [Lewinellaceae bacterium]
MKNFLLLCIPFLALAFVHTETPRVFLAGDSTMAPKKLFDAPETGWGNYVFLQFGHNDSKTDDSVRYAPAQTDYRQNLVRFIAEIRTKGAQPVLLTPVVRRNFDQEGHFVDKHGDYPAVVREVAAAQNVPLIDLWAQSKALLEKLGPEASVAMFMHLPPDTYPKFPKGLTDNTHFTPYGAALVAALAAEGVAGSKLALRQFLKKTVFFEKYAHELPQINLPVFRKDTINIRAFGAQAGGIALNTQAINTAIDSCSRRGGGVVLVPAGLWLSGPIRLRSHVNLHIEKGALLQFTDDLEQYPLVRTNWEGLDAIRNHSPIYGVDLEDVAITGAGILDGAGMAWRPLKNSKVTAGEWKKIVASGGVLNEAKDTWYPNESALAGSKRNRPGVIAEGYDETKAQEVKGFLRPNMVSLVRCNRVLIDGPTFQNSPAWTLHPLLCTHFTLKNVTVKNPAFAQNGDGVDLESTRFFRVENCVFDTGDDGVCLKSGRNEEGRKRGVPTSDGIVQNCVVYKAHGGFVIGSEMSGGVRNVFVSNCTFLGSDIGLRFKTTRGRGGVVEDIYISDINMTDIPAEAILFDMYYNGKEAAEALKNPEMEKLPVTEETPVFRRIYIQNVACRGAAHAVYVQGLPEMNVQDVHIENSVFSTQRGFTCVEGDGIRLKNVVFQTQSTDPGALLLNSRNLLFDNVQFSGNAGKALKIEGKQTSQIQLKNTNADTRGVEFGPGVSPAVLTQK